MNYLSLDFLLLPLGPASESESSELDGSGNESSLSDASSILEPNEVAVAKPGDALDAGLGRESGVYPSSLSESWSGISHFMVSHLKYKN